MLLHDCFGVETTYSIHPDVNPDKPADVAWGRLVGHERVDKDDVERLHGQDELRFVKTHACKLIELPIPAIYIVRHGCDTLVSHAHYRIDKQDYRNPFKEVLHNLVWKKRRGGGWGNHVMRWVRREAPTAILRYEDLLRHPVLRLRIALWSLGIRLQETDKQPPSFEALHKKWPRFFRKGVTGQWRDEMPVRTQRLFWKHHKDAMDLLRYT